MARWQEIDHTADLALHVWGQSLVELFAGAAEGMFSLVGEPDETGEWVTASVALSAIDVESLLVDWLNELLYLHERDDVIFTAFDIASVSPLDLLAQVKGRPVAVYLAHIKATTFNNLEVVETAEGYETEIVFDI